MASALAISGHCSHGERRFPENVRDPEQSWQPECGCVVTYKRRVVGFMSCWREEEKEIQKSFFSILIFNKDKCPHVLLYIVSPFQHTSGF